jgi:tetrahydromethanopterin S-methyltransferase subunit F
MSDRLIGQLVGQNERDPSGVAAAGVPELAGAIFSVGVANPAAGVFSNGIVGLAAVVLSLLSFGGTPPAGGSGVSTLPRMIGKPSLPLPMTTTFEFVDCES